jgi:hypothetical protein
VDSLVRRCLMIVVLCFSEEVGEQGSTRLARLAQSVSMEGVRLRPDPLSLAFYVETKAGILDTLTAAWVA